MEVTDERNDHDQVEEEARDSSEAQASSDLAQPEEPTESAENEFADADKRGIIESLIFSANDPVDAKKLTQVYAEVSGDDSLTTKDVYSIVTALNDQYAQSGSAFHIFEWAGGFRLATQPEYAPYVKSLHEIDSKRKLSRSLIETLAIIAYKQPVTKPEMDFVRGVDSDYAVRRLMELDLVDVIGRSESVGKPLLYGTTKEFLEKFGLNDLESLPNIREIEDLLDDPAFNRERAELLMSKGLSFGLEGKQDDLDSDADSDSADDMSEAKTEEETADMITVDPPHDTLNDLPPDSQDSVTDNNHDMPLKNGSPTTNGTSHR